MRLLGSVERLLQRPAIARGQGELTQPARYKALVTDVSRKCDGFAHYDDAFVRALKTAVHLAHPAQRFELHRRVLLRLCHGECLLVGRDSLVERPDVSVRMR